MTFNLLFFALILSIVSLAEAEPMYGLFMVVKGDVKVKNLQNQTAPVKVGSKVMPGESVISGADSRAKIVMTDRNVINVSPATEIKIDKYENDSKSGVKNVEINLVNGKARNNVEQKYDGEKSKFLMKTPTAVAGVRGTEFMVSYDSKTQMTQVVTLKGAVTFAPISSPGAAPGKAVTVEKGQMTSMAAGAAPEPPKTVPKEELKKMDMESTGQAAPKPTESSTASADKKSDSKREPSSEAAPAPAAAPAKMVDSKDSPVDAKNAVLIDPPPPPPPPPVVQQPVQLPPNLFSPNTKVKVNAVPQ
jgi:hypothetical protein